MSDILLNRYELIRPIGQGATGVTYLSKDLVEDRIVAIKQFHVSMESGKSWKREVAFLKRIDHPQLPKYLGLL